MYADNFPGPWRNENGAIKAITHGKWFTIARIEKPRFTQDGIKANADLIAAAPELFEALANLIDWCSGGDIPEDLYSAGRAAIAKAIGK